MRDYPDDVTAHFCLVGRTAYTLLQRYAEKFILAADDLVAPVLPHFCTARLPGCIQLGVIVFLYCFGDFCLLDDLHLQADPTSYREDVTSAFEDPIFCTGCNVVLGKRHFRFENIIFRLKHVFFCLSLSFIEQNSTGLNRNWRHNIFIYFL